VLTTRAASVETRTYTIRNVDPKSKTLIIEHPARPGYALLDRKPWEKTANAYRFEVKLLAGGSEKFPVVEERVYENSVAVQSLTSDMLFAWMQNKSLSEAGRRQLEQIQKSKEQIASAEEEIQRLDGQAKDLVNDQDRLRKNIASLNQVSGQQQQVQTYARQLAAQEGQLVSLRDRAAESRRRLTAMRQDLNKLVDALSF
jgi:chromosome segregation ATPase